jgi:hypothetical protein
MADVIGGLGWRQCASGQQIDPFQSIRSSAPVYQEYRFAPNLGEDELALRQLRTHRLFPLDHMSLSGRPGGELPPLA